MHHGLYTIYIHTYPHTHTHRVNPILVQSNKLVTSLYLQIIIVHTARILVYLVPW